MSIKRGTTPTHKFTTDIDLTEADEIFITYKQNTYVVVEKSKSDLDVITKDYIEVRLRQEDTLKFYERGNVYIQIRALFADETAVASNIMEIDVHKLLKEGVIYA